MATEQHKQQPGIVQRMRPIHRLFLSLACSLIAFFIIYPQQLNPLLMAMLLWIAFALVFNVTGWLILFTRPIHHIKKIARQDDGSKAFVFVMILLSSFASLFTVLLLMISGDTEILKDAFFLPGVIGGMLLSWIMVHTLFTFHYAHMYYDDKKESDSNTAEGLKFPGEKEPDYLDFAYFSFGIGCTFQVSDVQVTSRTIRRLVFLHSLLSFAINTFVVALTINLVAGMQK